MMDVSGCLPRVQSTRAHRRTRSQTQRTGGPSGIMAGGDAYCVIAARAAAEVNMPLPECATPGTTVMVWRS